MRESDILFESGPYWIRKSGKGFEVYENVGTHSVRRAYIGYEGSKGYTRARQEIEKRLAPAAKPC